MNGVRSRPALVAVLAAAVTAAGCTSPGAGQESTTGSPGRTVAPAGGTGPGPGTAGASAPARPSSTTRTGAPSSNPATRSATPLARPSIPSVTATAVGRVGYTAAPEDVRARFARLSKASGGLLDSASVKGLTVGGRDVGGVGVYGVQPGPAKSLTFQRQYLVQLVNAVAASTSSPRFVQADGQVLATSTGPTAVAGWFENGKVVLVYRSAGSPDLTALALGVRKARLPG